MTEEPAAPTGEYDPELYESPPITTPEPSG